MGAFVLVDWVVNSVLFLLGLYMLFFAHFPTYYVFLWWTVPYHLQMRYTPPDTYGVWVRIAGGCLIAGILFNVIAQFHDVFAAGFIGSILSAASTVCVILSFFNNRS